MRPYELASVVEPKDRCAWCWWALGIFAIGCAAGPIMFIIEASAGGDEQVAAAIRGAMVSGIILLVGLFVAVVAFIKHKSWPALRWLTLLLYLIPATVCAYCFAVGWFRSLLHEKGEPPIQLLKPTAMAVLSHSLRQSHSSHL